MLGAHTFQRFTSSSGAKLYRLPLEVFPNFWAYAYLVLTDDRSILIDCGSGTERSNAGLEAGFTRVSLEAGREVRIEDLDDILITHGHIDHYGGLTFLKPRTQARIGVHRLDWHTLCHHEERLVLMSGRLEDFLIEAGLDPEDRRQKLDLYRFTKALYRSVPVDYTLKSGGLLGLFEVIHLPGHCPGHVALRLDEFIFSGDNLFSGMHTHQSPEQLTPYTGLGHYLASLSTLERWVPAGCVLLPGHNDPIEPLQECLLEARRHLENRLREVLQVLEQPGTVSDAAARLYGELGGYNALLILEKAGAYLEYLYLHGWLGIEPSGQELPGGERKAIRYRRLSSVSDKDILPKERSNVFV
jgi:glyoxylase-like metal-dependent hydrolase (beta-lactamase superfamily II)